MPLGTQIFKIFRNCGRIRIAFQSSLCVHCHDIKPVCTAVQLPLPGSFVRPHWSLAPTELCLLVPVSPGPRQPPSCSSSSSFLLAPGSHHPTFCLCEFDYSNYFIEVELHNICPLKVKVRVLVSQLCLTLCDPIDCSPPGSSVHEILQARILEWVAFPFSKGSSQPRDQTQVSNLAGGWFTN